MRFVDTHIHLQDYSATPEEVIARLRAAGTDKVVCVSAHQSDWPKAAALADKFPDCVVPAFAVHPWYISEISASWAEQLADYLRQYPQAAIGECGFDRLKNPDFTAQKAVFDIHIELARKFQRPLLIHAVKAWAWLDEYWEKLPEKYVFHSFNAHPENLKNIIRYGGYVAVNEGIFKNKAAAEVIRQISLNRLLFESDAPYQSKAESLAELCRKAALIRDMDMADLAAAVYANSEEMLK